MTGLNSVHEIFLVDGENALKHRCANVLHSMETMLSDLDHALLFLWPHV